MPYTTAWWQNHISQDVRRRVRLLIAPARRNVPGRRPDWGNLRRAEPFSACFGFDRGQPVDRLYIERFLARMSHHIRGDVLEIRDSRYTRRYGAEGFRSHVLDIDVTNKRATIFGDLCDPGTLASAAYDCVILTQTLQYLVDPDAAIANLYTSLRFGGTMLITVPCSARIDPRAPESDYWRWTPVGLRALVERRCTRAEVEAEGGGNLVAALAVMLGCSVEDLGPQDLAADDPHFPVVSCAAITKPAAIT
jgi:hypothetical protein